MFKMNILHLKNFNILNCLFCITLFCFIFFIGYYFSQYMDVYERVMLFLFSFFLILFGWMNKEIRNLIVGVIFLSSIAFYCYGDLNLGNIEQAEQNFLLKYILASQSSILWMSIFFLLSTIFYLISFFKKKKQSLIGSKFSWSAVYIGFSGLIVRWYESYLIDKDIGHIPISNLYEVLILFCLITALFFLYYEKYYNSFILGVFVLWIIDIVIFFMLWYGISREAYQIQPLVPALQSWWMKIHVPANFIGYSTFSLSAMIAIAYILKYKNILKSYLPELVLVDDLMYKAIGIGFLFFTIATILGAFWAADAWGSYWSWDPKETWALIVWLNYAAWLHMRLIKGLKSIILAWWSFLSLFILSFAFLGVNIFLSGLHSYGSI